MSAEEAPRAVVVGGGVAGLTAATFTARNGVETLVVDGDESILARNAHLENVPGFPAGVNARTFLSLLREGARRNGVAIEDGTVVDVANEGDSFEVSLADGGRFESDYVLACSWADGDYLADLDVGFVDRGGKRFVQADRHGETAVDGLYAAGRVAEVHHQAVVAAGDGAKAALRLLEESDVPFYHDWVAPEGYFTERDREVPPGCEEIGEAERQRRERRSLEVIRERFETPQADPPTMHPSVVESREGDE
jgi:thioredoxin reductase (NADPH)